MKVGIIEDDQNRKELAEYLRFFSANSGEEYTSLKDYVEKMPENQKAIYYVTGEGKERAAMSPVAEKLKAKGFDVLYATEPLDESMLLLRILVILPARSQRKHLSFSAFT